jgi:hypothetical protein
VDIGLFIKGKPNTMGKKREIAKVCKKVNMNGQTGDFEYWQSQSYEARLAALEEIRLEYHGWTYETQPRLQRVCTIVKRK